MIISKTVISANERILNFTVNLINDGVNSTVFSSIVHLQKDILQLKFYVSALLPENRDDGHYRREILNTVISADKLINGIRSNFIGRAMLDYVFSCADFEIKLPIKKVGQIKLLESPCFKYVKYFSGHSQNQ